MGREGEEEGRMWKGREKRKNSGIRIYFQQKGI
jgi:hypothetical protein